MDRTEWLARRRECITGTDIAQIVGLSKWGGPLEVYADKLGLVEQSDEIPEHMQWGQILESVVADEYARRTGRQLVKGTFVRDGILGGTPDYLCKDVDCGLECKTSSGFAAAEWGDADSDEVPATYYLQCQWYMHLTGRESWDLAVLIDGRQYRIYHLHYKPSLVNELIKRARAFWSDHVLAKVPPSGNARSDTLNAVYKRESDDLVETSDTEVIEAMQELIQVRADIKELEKRDEKLTNRIKAAIGHNTGITCAYGSATWKEPKPSKKVDYKAICSEIKIPESLILKHSYVTESSRRFLLKPAKD